MISPYVTITALSWMQAVMYNARNTEKSGSIDLEENTDADQNKL